MTRNLDSYFTEEFEIHFLRCLLATFWFSMLHIEQTCVIYSQILKKMIRKGLTLEKFLNDPPRQNQLL